MKCLLPIVIMLIFSAPQTFAQTLFPYFLEGTWKMENRDIYERWEIEENESLMGTSYRIVNNEENITEYLKINKRGEQIIYTATVPSQNEGRGIEFILHQPEERTFSFENPDHDFPKKIIYQKRSDSEIYVTVSDGGSQGFAYTMKKVETDNSNLLMSYFGDISGEWIAAPADSSFISRLMFKKGAEQFLIPVLNTLTSKTGELFTKYEGVYIYNPVDMNISFTTVSQHEIHHGISWVKGDTLFHQANITGPGKIKSYTSSIIKKADNTLHYYADYSESEEYPVLTFSQPLIYRKETSGN